MLPKITVKDIITGFPLFQHKSNFHLRFKTVFQETEPKMFFLFFLQINHFLLLKSHGWLDISNFNAKVPLINNAVYMKILETPNQNCSRIYNQANLGKVLPENKPQSGYQQSQGQKEEPVKPQTQGFQGQPQHGKERKSHTFKSHSPQPEFHSDQAAKSYNKTTQMSGFNQNNFIQQSHSSENLKEKEFGSNPNPKASNFKNAPTSNITPIRTESPNPNQLKKKASLNLFEEEEKSSGQKDPGNRHRNNDDNLMLFSPTMNDNAKMKDLAAATFMDQDKFKLDEDLVGQLTGEQIAELKKQYVNQKMENKVDTLKIINNNIYFKNFFLKFKINALSSPKSKKFGIKRRNRRN